jgi:hypothetical protein
VLQDEVFYKFGQDNNFHCVLQLDKVLIILHELLEGIFPQTSLLKKLLMLVTGGQ